MSLLLIVGGAHAGKSTIIREHLSASAQAGSSALLLVPAAPDVSRETIACAATTHVGLSIRTFDDFLDDAWRQHGDGRAIAGPAHRLAVLEESVRTGTWSSRALQEPSSGVLRLMARLVQRAAEASTPLEPALVRQPIAHELAECGAVYLQLLSDAGLIERAEAHRLVAGHARELPLPDLIAVDAFTGFTSAQESFLQAASSCTEVIASLVYDPAVPATSCAHDHVTRLTALPGANCVTLAPHGEPQTELERIALTLGTTGSAEVEAAGAVVLSESWGRSAEAARIVCEVQTAMSDGMRPGEIAVVLRDAGRHLSSLGQAFAEAGLLVEFDARVPFSATALGRTLTLLLKLESLGHADMVDLLASPYTQAPSALVDEYDAFVRRARPGGSATHTAVRWFASRHPETTAFLRRARVAGRADSKESERLWYSVVSDMLAQAHQAPHGRALLTDAAAARAFMDAAEALAGLGESLRPEMLHTVLAETSVAMTSADSPQCVQVMGAERARVHRYRCVIVGDLAGESFPRSGGEDYLSDPEAIRSFTAAGVDLSPRSGIEQERLLFYQVVTRATERLVLSRQTHDDNGRPVRGSTFVDEVLDLYRDPETRMYFNGTPPCRSLGLDGLIQHEQAPRTERRTLRALASDGEPHSNERVEEARRRGDRTASTFSEAARRQAEDREAFSASELETYLQCPFRWCIQRLVQPRELDDTLDAAAAGRLGHEILRRFYDALPEATGSRRVTEELLGQADSLHHAVAEECLAEARPETAVEAVACRTVVRRTKRLIESDASFLGEFAPLHHEWSFGLDEGDEPEDFGGFSLRGRIDRLDADGRRLVLTDYKSRRIAAEHGVTRFESEGLVQLPLYAIVAARRFSLEVAGGIYRSLAGGKPRGFVRDDLGSSTFVSNDVVGAHDVERYLEQSVALASNAVERMRRGEIAPDPRGGSCPDYCPAKSFCAEWRAGRG